MVTDESGNVYLNNYNYTQLDENYVINSIYELNTHFFKDDNALVITYYRYNLQGLTTETIICTYEITIEYTKTID